MFVNTYKQGGGEDKLQIYKMEEDIYVAGPAALLGATQRGHSQDPGGYNNQRSMT